MSAPEVFSAPEGLRAGWGAGNPPVHGKPRVRIRDVTARDGLQGERPVDPADRVELVRRLFAAGLRDVEVASFVSPKAVPAMAGGADVVAAVLADVPDGATAWALVPNVKGAELATAAGVDHLTITVSASPAYSEKNVHMTLDEARAQVEAIRAAAPAAVLDEVISCAFGSPFAGEDITPDDVAVFVDHALAVGVDQVTLADTTGVGTPRRVSLTFSTTSAPTSASTSTTPGARRCSTPGRRSTAA